MLTNRQDPPATLVKQATDMDEIQPLNRSSPPASATSPATKRGRSYKLPFLVSLFVNLIAILLLAEKNQYMLSNIGSDYRLRTSEPKFAVGGNSSQITPAGNFSDEIDHQHAFDLATNNDNHTLVEFDEFVQYDGPTFIFVIGLEGTGHHHIMQLLNNSKYITQLNQMGMCKNGPLQQLSGQILFRGGAPGGLFNPINGAWSPPRDKTKVHPEPVLKGVYDSKPLFNATVNVLKTVSAAVRNNETITNSNSFNIAINANSCGRLMASYPTLRGTNYQFASVNLDIFYDACNEARVNCKHVYIYRNPYSVVQSTSINRRFNQQILTAVQMYTFHLHLIYSQLVYYSSRTEGCFGFLDVNGANRTEDWDRFGSLFGWDSSEEFRKYFKEIQKKAPSEMTESEKKRIVDPKLSVLMRGFFDIHERVVELCYRSLTPR